eukprot:snap_masked-scaffold_33-processed-gene-3.24-mRNA-1 protein AED:1.00 eAED:1.00 QI:0/0/0/0/1/1/3/0/257
MRIFMVDDTNFETIYVGRDTLFKLGAMPEQVFAKMPFWQRNFTFYGLKIRTKLKCRRWAAKDAGPIIIDASYFYSNFEEIFPLLERGRLILNDAEFFNIRLAKLNTNHIEKDIDFTAANETVDITEAADLLKLPSDKPIKLVNPYGEVDERSFPQASYFGGDGENLPIDIEIKKIKNIIAESISKTPCITAAQKNELKQVCFKNIRAFGLTQGTGQGSALTPVPCHLVPDAPLVFQLNPGRLVKKKRLGSRIEQWNS